MAREAREAIDLAGFANMDELKDMQPIEVPEELKDCSMLEIINARINGSTVDDIGSALPGMEAGSFDSGIRETPGGDSVLSTSMCEGCGGVTLTFGEVDSREITYVACTGTADRKCAAAELIRQSIADDLQRPA